MPYSSRGHSPSLDGWSPGAYSGAPVCYGATRMVEFQSQVVSMGAVLADLVGVFTSAWLGGATAVRKRMDIVGVVALGMAAGIGGGIVRDVMLQAGPPLALMQPIYLLLAVTGALAGRAFGIGGGRRERMLSFLDAITLGFFAVAGTQRALDAGMSAGPAILLGTVTAVGGGIIRDVLAQVVPRIFRPGPFYALAALLASAVYILLAMYLPRQVALLLGASVGIVLRLLAVQLRVKLLHTRE